MSYSPADPDNVDFAFESYSSPTSDDVDFSFTQQVVVRPNAVQLDLDPLDPFVGPTKQLVQPSTVQLDFDTPTPTIEVQTPIRPDAVQLDLSVPTTAGIAPFLSADEYQIDGRRIEPTSIAAGPQTIDIQFEVDRSALSHWRQYGRAGDISVQSGFGGQFRTIDRGGRSNTVELRSALMDSPPFKPSSEHYISSYSESQVAPDRAEISLTLQRVSNRQQGFPTVSDTGNAFDFDFSTATDSWSLSLDESRVLAQSVAGTTAGESIRLPLVLNDEQAGAILDVLGYPQAVVERSVPDATNTRVDESDGDRQTVTVDAPADAQLPSGTYFVTGWQLSQYAYADRRWRVDVELIEV